MNALETLLAQSIATSFGIATAQPEHVRAARAALEAMRVNRYAVTALPAVETDEWGDRVVHVALSDQPLECGKIRLGQGTGGDMLSITGVPFQLADKHARVLGAALIAAAVESHPAAEISS